ncbi:MAG: Fe-S cluster assembly protein SufD [Acetobacteraceae bacterium]
MSATLERTEEAFLARYHARAGSLPGAGDPRERAAAVFRARGLPDTHVEAWRFTNLRPLAGMAFGTAEASEAEVRLRLTTIPTAAGSGPLLVFANGRFFPAISRLPENVEVASFAARPSLAFAAGGKVEPEVLVVLNTMLAEDGAVISVPERADGGRLVLLHLGIGGAAAAAAPAFHPRHRIRLARGARLTLVEIAAGDGLYLHNPVAEVVIGESAELVHLRLQNESASAFHLGGIEVRLEKEARYQAFTLTLGARLSRSETNVEIEGRAATVHLDAAQLLDGEQHADITTVVRHAAPAATSRQTVKNVLMGHAHAVFQGKIAVARVAQKTDGYQRNETLLLSPTAEVNSKPELEIFADDVKCSHGATVGALDSNQLFYLQSRGVPAAEARAMLVRGFLADMFEAIPDDRGRSLLEQAASGWWKDRSV